MANLNDRQRSETGFGASPQLNGEVLGGRVGYDEGLRSHMLKIYNYMASGVLLSGIVAMLFAELGYAAQVMTSLLRWVIMLAPFGFLFAMNTNRSTSTLQTLFWGFCVIMGLSLSTVFLVFTKTSIATTFLTTAGAFAGLSLYGYTTKRNLSAMGSFMVMGLIGLLIAMLVNIFLASSALALVISVIGVLIFAGLTAWDTQALRDQYYQVRGSEFAGKVAVLGALTLYLDFINLFQFLLSFLGNRD